MKRNNFLSTKNFSAFVVVLGLFTMMMLLTTSAIAEVRTENQEVLITIEIQNADDVILLAATITPTDILAGHSLFGVETTPNNWHNCAFYGNGSSEMARPAVLLKMPTYTYAFKEATDATGMMAVPLKMPNRPALFVDNDRENVTVAQAILEVAIISAYFIDGTNVQTMHPNIVQSIVPATIGRESISRAGNATFAGTKIFILRDGNYIETAIATVRDPAHQSGIIVAANATTSITANYRGSPSYLERNGDGVMKIPEGIFANEAAALILRV